MREAILVIKDEMACGARGTGNEIVLVAAMEPVIHKECLTLSLISCVTHIIKVQLIQRTNFGFIQIKSNLIVILCIGIFSGLQINLIIVSTI